MAISRETIQEEIGFYKRLKSKWQAQLKGLPKGKIYFKLEHGKQRPYIWVDGNIDMTELDRIIKMMQLI